MTRLLAAAVDTVLVAVTMLGAYVAVTGVRFLVNPRGFQPPDPRLFTSLVVGAAVLGCYLTAGWATRGRTYGDLLMGLRVVTTGGDRVGWLRSAARAAAYLAFPAGLLWVAADPRCRSLQDLLVRTMVVYDWPHRAAAGAGPS